MEISNIPIDLNSTQAAWERYIANGEPIPSPVKGVRPEVLESWRRCKGLVDPHLPTPPHRSNEELQTVQEDNTQLIQIVHPYLERFYEYLQNTNYCITLADRLSCLKSPTPLSRPWFLHPTSSICSAPSAQIFCE